MAENKNDKELQQAKEREKIQRGTENVTDDSLEGDLPASARMRAIQRQLGGSGGESYQAMYARHHKGASVGDRVDRERLSTIRREAQREFARRTGMTQYEYNQLQKYKAINAERKKQFVAQARAGKFQGNIYLSGQNWSDLAAQVGNDGNLSEAVDLSEKGKNGKAMAELTKWAKSINDPNAARYGGRYNMSALPKGIFIQDGNGNWKVNEAMITSQAQVNALVQMMNQDNARQGAGKAEQEQRQKKTDDKNREFLKSQGIENVGQMNSEQLASQSAAIRQEIVDKTVEEYNNRDPRDPNSVNENDVIKEMQAAGKTATEINRALGRPDSLKEGAADVPDLPRTDMNVDVPVATERGKGGSEKTVIGEPTFTNDQGQMVNPMTGETRADEAIRLVNELQPASPREGDQSPKTDQSPKVTEEENK